MNTEPNAVSWELHRLALVIESAVRKADPDNHGAVLALIKANQDIVTGRSSYVEQIAESIWQTTAKPECPYCGATEGLRVKCDGGLSAFGFQIAPTEYTCESCFTGTDTGPCFDDLPEAPTQAS